MTMALWVAEALIPPVCCTFLDSLFYPSTIKVINAELCVMNKGLFFATHFSEDALLEVRNYIGHQCYYLKMALALQTYRTTKGMGVDRWC